LSTQPANVEAALDQAGLEYRAETNAAAQPTAKAVEQLQAQQSPAPGGSEGSQALAQVLVNFIAMTLPKLDKRLVYSDAEQAQIAAAAAPVIDKYFPDASLPVELVFFGVVATITAPKLMVAAESDTDEGGASEAPSPSAPPPPQAAH
jgi:hypothetical protein